MAGVTKTALVWPSGVERTAHPIAGGRVRIGASVADVLTALDLLGDVTSLPASEIVLTFEQNTRRVSAADGGAAVWFFWGEAQCCVACDLYAQPGNNLFAIAQLIRGCIAEHDRGSVAAVRHALESHRRRPDPPPAAPDPPPPAPDRVGAGVSDDWHVLLGVGHDASDAAITAAFRRLAHEKHPDKGGDRPGWDRLMRAYKQARIASITRQADPDRWDIADLGEEDALWSSLFPEETLEEPPTDR